MYSIPLCDPMIYTVLLFCALKTHHHVHCCGFYFFLWTKHVLSTFCLSQQDSVVLDYEVENAVIQSFDLAPCSPASRLLLLSVPCVGLVETLLLLFGKKHSAFALFRT